MLILPMTYIKCHAQDPLILLAPIIRDGVVYIGKKALQKALEPSKEKEEIIVEKCQVGKYEILLYDGQYQNRPCVYLDAFDNNVKRGWLAYDKANSSDMEKIAAFKKMTESERKVYLKETFERFNVFLDFGPIEEPVKAAETPAAKETASATTPQTTETAPAPSN